MISTYLYQFGNLVMLRFNKYRETKLRYATKLRTLILLSYTNIFCCFYVFQARASIPTLHEIQTLADDLRKFGSFSRNFFFAIFPEAVMNLGKTTHELHDSRNFLLQIFLCALKKTVQLSVDSVGNVNRRKIYF